MFDIGWSEILLVLVVALVVVGPKDLPRLMRMAGKWVGKARAMADQLRSSFDELARESELDELRKEIAALRAHNPVTQLHAEINRSIQPPEAAPPVPAAAMMGESTAADVPHDATPPLPSPEEIHREPEASLPEGHGTPLPPGFTPTGP